LCDKQKLCQDLPRPNEIEIIGGEFQIFLDGKINIRNTKTQNKTMLFSLQPFSLCMLKQSSTILAWKSKISWACKLDVMHAKY